MKPQGGRKKQCRALRGKDITRSHTVAATIEATRSVGRICSGTDAFEVSWVDSVGNCTDTTALQARMKNVMCDAPARSLRNPSPTAARRRASGQRTHCTGRGG